MSATAAVKFILACLDFDYDPVCLRFFTLTLDFRAAAVWMSPP